MESGVQRLNVNTSGVEWNWKTRLGEYSQTFWVSFGATGGWLLQDCQKCAASAFPDLRWEGMCVCVCVCVICVLESKRAKETDREKKKKTDRDRESLSEKACIFQRIVEPIYAVIFKHLTVYEWEMHPITAYCCLVGSLCRSNIRRLILWSLKESRAAARGDGGILSAPSGGRMQQHNLPFCVCVCVCLGIYASTC